MDEYLGKLLQNWTAVRRPPQNSRSRLLRTAAHAAYKQNQPQTPTSTREEMSLLRQLKTGLTRRCYRDNSHRFSDWTIVYSYEMSLANLKLMF